MSSFPPILIKIAYLLSASMFIIGLRYLNSPETARKGNLFASIGMFIAIVVTLLDRNVLNYEMIFAGIIIGSLIGATAARMVKMTAMPQLVGLFNGFGGGASALIAIGEFLRLTEAYEIMPFNATLTAVLGIFIGGITLTGSVIAFGKLQGIIKGAPITFPMQQYLNALLLIAFFAGGVYLITAPKALSLLLLIIGISLTLGVLFVIPIGGADMPVIISLLNSFSGLAASAAGFVLLNNVLIISGALVGAAGLILTMIMCKSMNRSLKNVLFGAFGTGEMVAGTIVAESGKTARSIELEEAAMMLAYTRSVIIVPGYGMAASQAHHAVRMLADQLESRGIDVKYGIHPVAGRMPGHMNVLLAEADVPYSQLYDMDDINPEFERTDAAVVIGANDTINPAARFSKGSPIYGMPILNVDKAKNIIIIKRSLNPGFSGMDNELFYNPKAMMLFGNANEVVTGLANEVKQL